MGGFTTQTAALQATGAQLEQLNVDIREQYTPVQTQVESLLNGNWTGGAARGFTTGWNEWQAGFEEAMTALAAMGRLLGSTGVNYETTEDTSSTGITSVGAPLL